MREKKASSFCYAQLPRAGLGNMLLVWARAQAFAHLNDIELIVASWGGVKVGPILRRERQSRFYFGYFKKNGNRNFFRRQMILRTYQWIVEPEIERLSNRHNDAAGNLYVFNQIPHWADYFKGIKEHRKLILNRLYSMLEEKHREELAGLESPGEDFAKVGHVRAPFSYFTNAIERLRAVSGKPLPVTIFSDGYDDELEELLKLPHVTRSCATSDVTDLLLLSKARVIIPSPGSTFGYWSAFLSNAAVLHHPDHFHSTVRSETFNRSFYEGCAKGETDSWPSLLKENIRSIV
ncbi:MAG: hypothetical protein AUG51_24865 [Acidobacteria bacterium 13_1_20CM_3_53_8]|nr:MAG: hypothetical protein AUG51_24865 [Acidobacteria bacterium 13_1_20CM_3_53_8]